MEMPGYGPSFDFGRQERAEKIESTIARKVSMKDEEALRYMLATEEGRWFVMRLFERCHIFSTTCPETSRPQEYFLWEGERRAALQTMQAISMLGREGLDARHKAESEYYEFEKQIERLRKEAEEGDE